MKAAAQSQGWEYPALVPVYIDLSKQVRQGLRMPLSKPHLTPCEQSPATPDYPSRRLMGSLMIRWQSTLPAEQDV
jgi:hypothetical protein